MTKMTMTIKPCFKCGGEGLHVYSNPYHLIECKECGYHTEPWFIGVGEDDEASIKYVIDAWNEDPKRYSVINLIDTLTDIAEQIVRITLRGNTAIPSDNYFNLLSQITALKTSINDYKNHEDND